MLEFADDAGGHQRERLVVGLRLQKGDDSELASVERALELQPQARVRWFEDTIHDVPLQRPEELARELQAFVQRILP